MSIQEKEYLEIYKKQKEDHLGWGTSDEWTNQDFEKLSELIFEKTNVRLSASTLKRVWGKVKYDSAPTLTTLNTLAQFSGYENWRSFRSAVGTHNGNGGINGKIPVVIEDEAQENQTQPLRRKFTRVIIAVVLFGFAVLIYFLTLPEEKVDTAQVTFTARVVSDDLPNSVVFDYNVPNTDIDSVTIQQSWDPKRRERVPAANHKHTSIYYFPGLYEAKILVNDKILKEQDVLIQTKGWKGIIDEEPVPTYLSQDEIALDGNSMQITSETLQSKTGKTVFNNVWTDFYNIKSFDQVKGDNFTLTVSVQNTSKKEEAVCQQLKLRVLGSEGVIRLPFCSRGCTSAISAFMGDTTVDGKDNDLSAFGCDFTTPQQVKCEVKNKKVSVYLNGKNIFTYDKPVDIGKVVGIIIGIEGTGKVGGVEIK